MLKPHLNNNENNFIAGWYMEDTSLCDELIDYFNTRGEKFLGGLYRGDDSQFEVDFNVKDSVDCCITDGNLNSKYLLHLQDCVNEYVKLYPESGETYSRWSSEIENKNIQYYKPNGGYKLWHYERRCVSSSRRHLVFMTYLNTLVGKGGTSFKYQNLTVQAEKGLTLIWPTDWTHTHKSNVSENQEKYIVTGWFNYVL